MRKLKGREITIAHRSLPHTDEARMIIVKIIEQSVRDYLGFQKSRVPIERFHFRTAYGFLFENVYIIDYGEVEVLATTLMQVINVDPTWLRERVLKMQRTGKRPR